MLFDYHARFLNDPFLDDHLWTVNDALLYDVYLTRSGRTIEATRQHVSGHQPG